MWMCREVVSEISCPLEYFSSAKVCNGQQLLSQFLNVVQRCEEVNIRIHGLCSDAGGGNAQLIRILRQSKCSDQSKQELLGEGCY